MTGVVVFLGIALLIVLISLGGLALVRRFVSPERLAGHTDVAGYIYAVVGVLYAVILAQVVVAAWGEYQDARTAAANEANAVLNLQRLSREWPETDHEAVRAGLLEYAQHVVTVEWPELEAGDLMAAINPSPIVFTAASFTQVPSQGSQPAPQRIRRSRASFRGPPQGRRGPAPQADSSRRDSPTPRARTPAAADTAFRRP